MKQPVSVIFRAVAVAATFVIFSACNGKLDQDLVESITGKISVGQVIIDQDDFTMTVGESTELTAVVLPEDATDKTVTWSSSKEDVVMVSSNGKVIALAPGNAVITAKAGSKTDFITITVEAKVIRVTGIALDKTLLTLKVDEFETLTAAVTPEDATNKNVSWTSSDASVASVENGKVTGVKPGSVTVTAKTEDGSRTAECAVTVKTNLAPSVTVGADNISAVSVVLKGEANLDAQISSDMTMGIMWSENSGVLPSNSTRIDAEQIEAKAGSTSSYYYQVNLKGLTPNSTYYYRSYVTQKGQDTYGETKSFTTKELSSLIHTDDASNLSAVSSLMNGGIDFTDVQYASQTSGFYWGASSSSLTTKVQASPSPYTGALSASLSTLTPSTRYYYQAYVIIDNKEYKAEVKNFTTKALSSLLYTDSASHLSAVSAAINGGVDFTDVRYNSRLTGFYWGTSSSSLTTKVQVSPSLSTGELSANLSALAPASRYYYQAYVIIDNKEYKAEVKNFTTKAFSTMLETVDASDVAPTEARLNARLDLTDVRYGSLAYGFYWGTSESSQNTYLKGGALAENAYAAQLTGLSHKTQYWYKAYVKIDGQTFYGDVKSFSTEVVPVDGVSLNKTEHVFHMIGETLSLTATVSPSDATNKSVGWQSSDESVAVVSQSGTVTAKGNGTATITVTTSDQQKAASCLVTVSQWVTGISLNKSTLSLYPGQTDILTASVSPSTALNPSVEWSSSNTSVATVSASGVVTGVARGNAIITATAKDGSGVSKSCSVEVKQYVTEITLSKTSLTLNEGETALLTETVSPSTATVKTVTWSSSDRSVATVDQTGKVTAVSKGSATITVTANDGSGISASCEVMVNRLVSFITLNKTSLTLNEGETETLTATVSPSTASSQTLVWASSNTSVATVDQNGKVMAVSKGSATITATANDGSGKSASCSVTVKRLVSSITLDKTSITIYNAKTETLTATVSPSTANNTSVTWSSSNTSVATVSSSGVVTGVAAGTATITVAAQDGSGVKATCAVTVRQYVTSITLNKTALTLNEGQTSTLAVTSIAPENAYDKTYTWWSSNTSVATVDETGKVTAVSKGTATIMATANDGCGKSASCEVTVNRLVTSITLDKTSITIYNGKTETLTATVSPSTANNTSVTWSSSNTSVATVSSSGVVTGVSRGTATITVSATDGSGVSKTCEVEVKQFVTGISLNKTSLILLEGDYETLTATVTPDNANDKTLVWSSSNTSVATVDQTGKVTVVSKGTATITATANDGSGKKATCSISVFVRTDLSFSKSANCYIVSSAGGYKFKTVQGNSSTSVGNASMVEVLWESFGTSTTPTKGAVISSVSYSGNYITFATPSTLKNGNALIAAKDASGNILWSWHIWVCEGYDPVKTAQTYKNSAGVMMDRNLGATSASVGNVGSLGLLYQWGRKDPFLNGCQVSYDSNGSQTRAASTLSWPSSVSSDSSTGTKEYAVAHPTTFITRNSNNRDWYYSSSTSTDNTRWQSSKTIYDPCPPGWRVPDGGSSGVWSKAVNSSDILISYTWDSTNNGMNFSGKFGSASPIWYPAAGYLSENHAGLVYVGSQGWWSYTPNSECAYGLTIINDCRVFFAANSRANGYSVRCLKE